MQTIELLDGKYTFRLNIIAGDTFVFACDRYGETWIPNMVNVAGSRAVLALCDTYLELKEKYDELKFRMDGLEK